LREREEERKGPRRKGAKKGADGTISERVRRLIRGEAGTPRPQLARMGRFQGGKAVLDLGLAALDPPGRREAGVGD